MSARFWCDWWLLTCLAACGHLTDGWAGEEREGRRWRTSGGVEVEIPLPDEAPARLLVWVEEEGEDGRSAAVNLTYAVWQLVYPALSLTFPRARAWHEAAFYHDRVLIPGASVDKRPSPPSWWGRRVLVASGSLAYYHLCPSPYLCSPERPPSGEAHPAGVAGGEVKSVDRCGLDLTLPLGVLCVLLVLLTLAQAAYICYAHRKFRPLQPPPTSGTIQEHESEWPVAVSSAGVSYQEPRYARRKPPSPPPPPPLTTANSPA